VVSKARALLPVLLKPVTWPFEQMLREKLSSDPTIRSHLAAPYDTLPQQNLLRIVESYSIVVIKYVAGQGRQGRQYVEKVYYSSRVGPVYDRYGWDRDT
jgi:hypothetical protein